jgi:hypothetical protein
MGVGDTIKSIFGDEDEPEDNFDSAFEQEALVPDTAGTSYQPQGGAQDAVRGSLGSLEELALAIPGYKGYKEKELRREADKLLRLEVAGKLDDQRKRLSELQMQLINQSQITYVDDLDRAASKLQLLIDRVTTASYGYAGLFDAVKIKEEQLDALYEFDTQMLASVDEIAGDVDQVSSAISVREGIGEAITGLAGTVQEANLAFGHREEAILQASAWE